MSAVWNKRSGAKLAVLEEKQSHIVDLPIESNIPIELISGEIPPGMSLQENTIIGTPEEVPRNTVFRFVLRAVSNGNIFDRTYSIEIQGDDQPEWITPADLLPVGKNQTFYVLDSSPIDYQLEAFDSDTAAGQKLTYFIASNDGELPPGIQLTEDGRLVGIVDPILALEKDAANGFFDTSRFDKYPFDFAVTTAPGEPILQPPRKLNQYYEFTVSVSDGDTVSKRTFRIFVVGDDFLRADNAIMQVGTGIFTADNTYLRTPIWVTRSNLGIFRANNFITLFLDTLDPNDIAGTIAYDLIPENDDGSRSELPPGTEFDRSTGEVFGRIPYQPAITREYKFTVRARRIEAGLDTFELQQFAIEDTPKNSIQIKINKLNDVLNQAIDQTFTLTDTTYTVTSINAFNSDFDVITLDQPLTQSIDEGQTINLGRVSVTASETAESKKTFTVTLIGEIDSTIEWLTDKNLETIPSNYRSTLKVQAETTVPNSFLLYTLQSGELPPGLSLSFAGEIIGKVDNEAVTEDAHYTFTVKAQDQFGFSAIERTFNISVENIDDTLYSNIYYKPLLPFNERAAYRRLISDPEIFFPESIYRPDDSNFGIQKQIEILLYAGIETELAEIYTAAAAKHAARKTLKIRDVKKAVAKEPGTNNEVYEVVYLDVYDPYERSGDVKNQIKITNSKEITVDSMRTTPDNPLYDTTRLSYVFVDTRYQIDNKIYFDDTIPVTTRSGTIDYSIKNDPVIGTRENNDIKFDFDRGSSTNIFYRPENENTVRADSNIVKASDTKNQTRYISNTSNIRDSLRDIGETERNFLPLWMRTAQPGTLQELGYTLAIPLAYCKPGEADRILSAIRIKEFDFRQLNLEVDRFVIDSIKGKSSEQYIVFANYEFNLA